MMTHSDGGGLAKGNVSLVGSVSSHTALIETTVIHIDLMISNYHSRGCRNSTPLLSSF